MKSVLCKCFNCGKPVEKYPSDLRRSKSGNVYCSKKCAVSKNNALYKHGEMHPNYTQGRGSYRNRKLRYSENKCERCGIDNKIVLEVHHIDGNRKNCKLENLKILCANCHLIEQNELTKIRGNVLRHSDRVSKTP